MRRHAAPRLGLSLLRRGSAVVSSDAWDPAAAAAAAAEDDQPVSPSSAPRPPLSPHADADAARCAPAGSLFAQGAEAFAQGVASKLRPPPSHTSSFSATHSQAPCACACTCSARDTFVRQPHHEPQHQHQHQHQQHAYAHAPVHACACAQKLELELERERARAHPPMQPRAASFDTCCSRNAWPHPVDSPRDLRTASIASHCGGPRPQPHHTHDRSSAPSEPAAYPEQWSRDYASHRHYPCSHSYSLSQPAPPSYRYVQSCSHDHSSSSATPPPSHTHVHTHAHPPHAVDDVGMLRYSGPPPGYPPSRDIPTSRAAAATAQPQACGFVAPAEYVQVQAHGHHSSRSDAVPYATARAMRPSNDYDARAYTQNAYDREPVTPPQPMMKRFDVAHGFRTLPQAAAPAAPLPPAHSRSYGGGVARRYDEDAIRPPSTVAAPTHRARGAPFDYRFASQPAAPRPAHAEMAPRLGPQEQSRVATSSPMHAARVEPPRRRVETPVLARAAPLPLPPQPPPQPRPSSSLPSSAAPVPSSSGLSSRLPLLRTMELENLEAELERLNVSEKSTTPRIPSSSYHTSPRVTPLPAPPPVPASRPGPNVPARSAQRVGKFALLISVACTCGGPAPPAVGTEAPGADGTLAQLHRLLVSARGFDDADIRVLSNAPALRGAPGRSVRPPTSQQVLAGLDWLTAGRHAGDVLFLAFSTRCGHGRDVNGDGDGEWLRNGLDVTAGLQDRGKKGGGADALLVSLAGDRPLQMGAAAASIPGGLLRDRAARLAPGVALTVLYDACRPAFGLGLPVVHDVLGLVDGCDDVGGAGGGGSGVPDAGLYIARKAASVDLPRAESGRCSRAGSVLLLSAAHSGHGGSSCEDLRAGALTRAFVDTLSASSARAIAAGGVEQLTYRQVVKRIWRRFRASGLEQHPCVSTSHPFQIDSPFEL